jgi:hypothetical protein
MTQHIERRVVGTARAVRLQLATLAPVGLLAAAATVGVAACGGSQKPSG